MSTNTLNTLKEFKISGSKKGTFYSLPALENALGVNISRLPVFVMRIARLSRSWATHFLFSAIFNRADPTAPAM